MATGTETNRKVPVVLVVSPTVVSPVILPTFPPAVVPLRRSRRSHRDGGKRGQTNEKFLHHLSPLLRHQRRVTEKVPIKLWIHLNTCSPCSSCGGQSCMTT